MPAARGQGSGSRPVGESQRPGGAINREAKQPSRAAPTKRQKRPVHAAGDVGRKVRAPGEKAARSALRGGSAKVDGPPHRAGRPTGAAEVPSDAGASSVTPKPGSQTRAGVRSARVIAIANQKGGVGKSTTAVNLGACLAEVGQRVLVIDLDPQGNASTGVGIGHSDREVTIYEVLTAGSDMHGAILETEVPGLAVVPSTIDLAGAEIELVSQFSREARLARALESVRGDYDFILLDCPPSLGLLTVNALTAAAELIVPIQCEYYALEGLGQLLKNVRLVQQNVNPRLRLTGIVMTMFDSRTKLADQVVAEVRAYFGPRVYDSIIPRSVRLAEAPGFGKTILQYDPASKGAKAYRGLANELLTKAAGDGLGELDLTNMGQGVAVQEPSPTPKDLGDGGRGYGEGLDEVGVSSGDAGPAGSHDHGEDEDEAAAEIDDRPPVPGKEGDELDQAQAVRPMHEDPLPEWDTGLVDAGDRRGGGDEADEEGPSGPPGEAEPHRPEEPPLAPEPTADAEPPLAPEPTADAERPRVVEPSGGLEPGPTPAPEVIDQPPPQIVPESPVSQAFSPSQRLVHIVSDEWEGLGVSLEEDRSGDEVELEQVEAGGHKEGAAAVTEERPPAKDEPPVGKVRRWLFGKSKGGGA
jgi:chromosome partitioning protein